MSKPVQEITMKKLLVYLAILSLILAACKSQADVQVSDPAKNLEATVGNEFKIVIASNASTGYHWGLVGDLDTTIVEYVSNEYKGIGPAVPGKGGEEVWTFKAVAAGQTQITLGYYPPSNQPTDPQQTITFTVVVK
jgi:inhibitor of cysteine peptidase